VQDVNVRLCERASAAAHELLVLGELVKVTSKLFERGMEEEEQLRVLGERHRRVECCDEATVRVGVVVELQVDAHELAKGHHAAQTVTLFFGRN